MEDAQMTMDEVTSLIGNLNLQLAAAQKQIMLLARENRELRAKLEPQEEEK